MEETKGTVNQSSVISDQNRILPSDFKEQLGKAAALTTELSETMQPIQSLLLHY